MAGGTWRTQNKIIPGAYINFETVPRPPSAVGDRGIGAIMIPLPWGPEEGLIDVLSEDLIDGRSLPKIGLMAADEGVKLLGGMLSYCYRAQVFRADTGGKNAEYKKDALTITAKHPGTFGNKITVVVEAQGDQFRVSTVVDGVIRSSQVVEKYEDLKGNPYVDFEGAGDPAVSAGLVLEGGENGTVNETKRHPQFRDALKKAAWQVMAVTTNSAAIKKDVAAFIEELRDSHGKYVQAVMPNYSEADHESIYSVINSFDLSGEDLTLADACAIAAGIVAGAPIANSPSRSASNTGFVVRGAGRVVGELDEPTVIEAIESGHIVFARTAAGGVKLVRDVTTLRTFTDKKGKAFSKGRLVRTCDGIGSWVKLRWETVYEGRVDNNEEGRSMLRADIISYLSELQGMGVIQNFAGAEHVQVQQGEELDSVLAVIQLWPVDSMEFLYLTCLINS